MKERSVADVKREFRSALDEAERGEPTLILRRGRPVAALVPAPETQGELVPPPISRPGGLLALVGLLADWDTIDGDVAAVLRERASVMDRPSPNLD